MNRHEMKAKHNLHYNLEMIIDGKKQVKVKV
jgi:hypothetical protein